MTINGTKWDDVLVGTRRGEVINALEGDDVVYAGDGNDMIHGHKGNDRLYGEGGNDHLSGGNGDDVLEGGAGADDIDGGAGVDTISYASSSAGVYLGLANGIARGGDAEGDTFEDVENISGSQGGDFLMGDVGNNAIYGNDGRDFLTGRGGADYLDGGAGIDDAEYVDSDAGVTVNLTTGKGTGGSAEGDVLVNIEYVHGSMFDDHLIGDGNANRLVGRLGADWLEGRAGNDILLGGRGPDILDGGAGSRDAADYSWSDHGVIVNLETGNGQRGDAEGDTLINIEYLYGSDFDDILIGDDGVNRLVGRAGNDTLDGGAGNDILVGGEGADIFIGGMGLRDAADYEHAAAGVGVDLIKGGFDGEAAGDTFMGIEYVYGSLHADEIHGDDGVNRLVGRDGDDVLNGRGGNDYLLGELGNDILIGGDGDDVFIFHGGDGHDVIKDFEAGVGRTDRIWLKDVTGIENFADIKEHATTIQTETGMGVKIDLGMQGSITLEGLKMIDQLAEDDFIY